MPRKLNNHIYAMHDIIWEKYESVFEELSKDDFGYSFDRPYFKQ